ncbi:hypothetical protein QUA69_28425, partial [Microcoleus sp. LAD1_D1]|uniref:hypothetical protein n=1 Tax=Microcoleus sp. LAD1_D1 TaxID=2818812 RepID=UPI002FD49304
VTVPDRMGLAPDVSAKRQVADGGNVPTVSPKILLAFQEISPESTVEEISSLIGMHQNIDVARAKQFANLYEHGEIVLKEVVEFADMNGRFRKVSLKSLTEMVQLKRNRNAQKGRNGTVSPFAAAEYSASDRGQAQSRSLIIQRYLSLADRHIDNYIEALNRQEAGMARGNSFLDQLILDDDVEGKFRGLLAATKHFHNTLLGGPMKFTDLVVVLHNRIAEKKKAMIPESAESV